MKLWGLPGLAALLVAACASQGQEPTPTPEPTATPAAAQSQNALTRQATEAFDQADAELNAVYRKLMAAIPEARRARLKEAQRAWIVFRDADGRFAASAMEGGSAYPMIYAGSRARLTQERTRYLTDLLAAETTP